MVRLLSEPCGFPPYILQRTVTILSDMKNHRTKQLLPVANLTVMLLQFHDLVHFSLEKETMKNIYKSANRHVGKKDTPRSDLYF